MKTKMKFTKRFFSVLFIAGLMMACSKDGQDGAVGPQGAQGEQGAAGAQGEQGNTGTANVISSDWIPMNFISPGAQQSNVMWLDTFSSKELNPATDVVLVYGQRDTDGDNNGVYPLPFILATQDEYYGYGLFGAKPSGTGIQVRVNSLDGGVNLFTFFTEYRYVIIPGGNPASSKSSVDYTKMTYEEIAELFNIKD